MPGNSKKSPQNKQPKKKKRRVNSQKDTKGQSQCVETNNGGVSTLNSIYVQPPNTHSIGLNQSQTVMNMSSFQNPQSMQIPGAMPGAMSGAFGYSSPPPSQGMGVPFNFGQPITQMNVMPDWAKEMSETIKTMSQELGKLSSIEKTLSGIQLSVHNLETKVGTMESKLINCERSCTFLSNQYEDHKKELESAKSNVLGLQKRCTDLENKCKDYEIKSSKTHKKLLDLESRNMRENLVFHGLSENVNENCEVAVKQFCHEELKISDTEVGAMVFDRAHRIGRIDKLKPGAVRPIVVKFHRYSEREKVREIGYSMKDALKAKNLAVRPQLPSEVLENRKPLYPIFDEAKAKGSSVKFVLDRLYIDGKEYVPPVDAAKSK